MELQPRALHRSLPAPELECVGRNVRECMEAIRIPTRLEGSWGAGGISDKFKS